MPPRKAVADAIPAKHRIAIAGYAVCAALTAATAIALSVLFSSCATSQRAGAFDPFSALGDGAAVYLAFPVAENRALADMFARSMAPEGGAEKALDRTRRAYAAIYPDGSVRLVAQGSYPRSAASLIFPSSKGWKKMSGDGATWYRRDSVDAALPRGGIAFIAAKSDMKAMLSAGTSSSVSLAASGFPETAGADLASGSGAINIYIADAPSWIGVFLGPDLSLPVDHATVRALPEGADTYRVGITVAARDARTARAMASIVRLAFQGSNPTVAGSNVSIQDISMSAEKLVEFAKNLYFLQ